MKSKAYNSVDDGEDLYVEEDKEASTREKYCNNAGCGKTYTDVQNSQDACWHHPGKPIFHEGLKGWQCCSKRVVDFDEAMSLPGCALGPHKSIAPELKTQVMRNKPVDPKYLPKTSVGGVETFDLGGAATAPRPAKLTAGVVAPAPPAIVEEPDDPMDAVIEVGTKCRHNGCHRGVFAGDDSRTETCVYHPGLAVFHEGNKYWTCCKPRCAEFEEFLKIPGCKSGRHKFCPKPEDIITDPLQVKCRSDFYQQGQVVMANIYAKNIDRTASSIEFLPQTLVVKLKFKDGKHFIKDIKLFGEIDASTCKFEFLSTKAEITLHKATPIVWDSLEFAAEAPTPTS